MIRRNTWLRSSTTLATALVLVLIVGCAEQPTEALLTTDGVSYLSVGDTGSPVGDTSAVTPSTNEDNKANGWAYVAWNSDDAGVGEAPLVFVSTRTFLSCFEVRIDGEPPIEGEDNYNPGVTDGLWPSVCVNNETKTLDLTAEHYVDVRMVFGAETDERFDWTRFYVQIPGFTKQDCKNGGWMALGFRNQGQCIRFTQTGKDSRTGVFGAVLWKSALGLEGLWTNFYVNVETESGSVWFTGPGGSFTMTVECAAVDGNEAWAGGTVTDGDGAYAGNVGETRLFYAKDDEPDGIGSWNQRSCDNGFPGSGTTVWRGGGTVTDGDLIVR